MPQPNLTLPVHLTYGMEVLLGTQAIRILPGGDLYTGSWTCPVPLDSDEQYELGDDWTDLAQRMVGHELGHRLPGSIEILEETESRDLIDVNVRYVWSVDMSAGDPDLTIRWPEPTLVQGTEIEPFLMPDRHALLRRQALDGTSDVFTQTLRDIAIDAVYGTTGTREDRVCGAEIQYAFALPPLPAENRDAALAALGQTLPANLLADFVAANISCDEAVRMVAAGEANAEALQVLAAFGSH